MRIFAWFCLAWVGAFSISGSEAADAPKAAVLTLAEAQQLALKQHPKISVAQLQALAAGQNVRQVQAAYFPTLSANATAVGAADDNTRIAAGGLNNPAIFDRNAEGVTLSQIVTDFGRTANLSASAKLRQRAAEENTIATRAQILLQVDTAYFLALQANAVKQVAEQTIKTRQLLLDQVSALASNKLKSELDVSFARVAFEEGNLLLAKAQNDLQASHSALATMIGEPRHEPFALAEQPLPPPAETNMSQLIQSALQHRPELAQLRLERDAAFRLAKAEKALNYPTLSVVGSAGVIPVRDERLEKDYAAAGINLNFPLFAGGLYSARQKEARLRFEAAGERLRDQENSVVQEVQTASFNASYARERLGLTARLLEQANKAFELAQIRYKVGGASIVELSQAQLNQTSAEIAQSAARYDYEIAQARLGYQLGELQGPSTGKLK